MLLCSGKVYYDLAAERAEDQRSDVAILRVEQLYPLPADELARRAGAVSRTPSWSGCRRSRRTRARWPFIALNLPEHLGGRPLLRVSRRASASPAVGSLGVHEAQQREVVAVAFG